MTDTITCDAEDQPGYDGPTYDSADRLHMWMDKSVPAVDRSRLIVEHRDQVLTEAAHLLYKADYDAHFISLCCKDCAMESAAGVLLAARTTVGPASLDEWVRCSGPHCPNGERRHLAVERGWQSGGTDTWNCPKCVAARTTATQEG